MKNEPLHKALMIDTKRANKIRKAIKDIFRSPTKLSFGQSFLELLRSTSLSREELVYATYQLTKLYLEKQNEN